MADVISLDAYRSQRDSIEQVGAANMAAVLKARTKGKRTKYSIEVSGDTILADTDPIAIGAEPAAAIAKFLREKIQALAAPASAATVAYRARAREAFADGKSWAKRRYGGGRIGTLTPGQSDRAWNDSGRFAASLVATLNKTEKAWTINVAANRLSNADAPKLFARLQQLVPEFADTRRLLDSPQVTEAISSGIAAATVKASEGGMDRAIAVMRSRLELLRAVG